jgi:hypothetical protein
VTADQAKALSIEVARGLGFKLDKRTVERVRFNEPMAWLSAAAELEVTLTSRGDDTAGRITGSSAPGRRVAPCDYVARCVAAVADGLRTTAGSREAGGRLMLRRLERGAGLFTLVFVIIFIGFASRPLALVPFVAAWVAAILPAGLQCSRRYKAGIFGARDAVRLLAYVVFLAAAVVGFLAYLRVIF